MKLTLQVVPWFWNANSITALKIEHRLTMRAVDRWVRAAFFERFRSFGLFPLRGESHLTHMPLTLAVGRHYLSSDFMKLETKETLLMLIEESAKLGSFNFAKILTSRGRMRAHLVWSSDNVLVGVEHDGQTDESVDAFIPTFRLFILETEKVSFRSLAKIVGLDDEVSDEWKRDFARVRSQLNVYLDGPSEFYELSSDPNDLPILAKPIRSKRELLYTFIYGAFLHRDEEYRKALKDWQNFPAFYSFLQFEFLTILAAMLEQISYVAIISKRELGLT
jgi:hypothetical protein